MYFYLLFYVFLFVVLCIFICVVQCIFICCSMYFYLCCSMYFYLCSFMYFYLCCFMYFYLCCSMYCLCVNLYCHRVTTQLKLINISISISIKPVTVPLCRPQTIYSVCRFNAVLTGPTSATVSSAVTLRILVQFGAVRQCSWACVLIWTAVNTECAGILLLDRLYDMDRCEYRVFWHFIVRQALWYGPLWMQGVLTFYY